MHLHILLIFFYCVYIIKTVTKSVEMTAYSYNINAIKRKWLSNFSAISWQIYTCQAKN